MSPIRWKLWLTRPSTGRGLRAGVHCAFAACALWLGASVYGVYGARAALDAEKAGIVLDRKHADEVALSVRTDHSRVSKADRLSVDTSDGVGGVEFANEIDGALSTANVILLLVSADFINSDYCFSIEMTEALQRNNQRPGRSSAAR